MVPEGFKVTVPRAGSITLSWDDPNDAAITHQYQQREKGQSWPTAWTDVPANANTVTISSGLSSRTFYEYQVRAIKGTSTGDPTEPRAGAFGSLVNDDLTGTVYPDYVLARAGNDNLKGEAGDDTFNGGAGADRIDGGAGSDNRDLPGLP